MGVIYRIIMATSCLRRNVNCNLIERYDVVGLPLRLFRVGVARAHFLRVRRGGLVASFVLVDLTNIRRCFAGAIKDARAVFFSKGSIYRVHQCVVGSFILFSQRQRVSAAGVFKVRGEVVQRIERCPFGVVRWVYFYITCLRSVGYFRVYLGRGFDRDGVCLHVVVVLGTELWAVRFQEGEQRCIVLVVVPDATVHFTSHRVVHRRRCHVLCQGGNTLPWGQFVP